MNILIKNKTKACTRIVKVDRSACEKEGIEPQYVAECCCCMYGIRNSNLANEYLCCTRMIMPDAEVTVIAEEDVFYLNVPLKKVLKITEMFDVYVDTY